jgi:hypothetical protein
MVVAQLLGIFCHRDDPKSRLHAQLAVFKVSVVEVNNPHRLASLTLGELLEAACTTLVLHYPMPFFVVLDYMCS